MGFTTSTVKALFGHMSYSAVGRKGNSFRGLGSHGVTLTVPEDDAAIVEGMILRAGYHTTDETWDEYEYPAPKLVNRDELAHHFTKGATSKEASREILHAVLVDNMHMVSADGYRLFVSHTQSGLEGAVLAFPYVGAFIKAAPLADYMRVSWVVDGGWIHQMWECGSWRLEYTITSDMHFPEYKQIIPHAKETRSWYGMMALAKQLPKADVLTAIVRLGDEPWPLSCKMAVAPLYLKSCIAFLESDYLTASTVGVVYQNYTEGLNCGSPLHLENGRRETVVMPIVTSQEDTWTKADPITKGLYWKVR